MARTLTGAIVVALALIAPAAASGDVVSLYNQSFEEPTLTLEPELEPKPPGWIWTGDFDVGTKFNRIEDPTAPDGKWVLVTSHVHGSDDDQTPAGKTALDGAQRAWRRRSPAADRIP